jgi:hypothetical protein
MGHGVMHRQLHDYFNNRQFDQIRTELAPEFLFEELPSKLTFKTPDEFIGYLGAWVDGFSDGAIGSAEYDDGADFSVATFHARGTNDGAFNGMPPTGRQIDCVFTEILHFGADGKVLSGRLNYDRATIMSQLGYLPDPSAEPPSLTEAVRRMFRSFDTLDVAGMLDQTTADAQGVDEIARTWMRGHDAIEAYLGGLGSMVSDVHSEVSDFEERRYGDTGIVTCWLEQDYTIDDNRTHVSAPCTFVLRLEDGAWKSALISAVPLPEEQQG